MRNLCTGILQASALEGSCEAGLRPQQALMSILARPSLKVGVGSRAFLLCAGGFRANIRRLAPGFGGRDAINPEMRT